MVQLQTRDQKLLTLAFDHQFIPKRDAQRFVFNSTTKRHARQRLAELEHAGYIQTDPIFRLGSSPIIRLTKQGLAFAKILRPYEIPRRRKLDPLTFVHDSIVLSTRLRLEELWDATWIPEGALKAEQYPQIPDGVMVFPSGAQIAVEIENSDKGVTRFNAIQERWRQVPVRLVLYVATQATLYKAIQKYLNRGPQDIPFGVISWLDLDQGQPKVWTVRGEIDLLGRRTIG